MTIPIRSVVRHDRDPDELPPAGGLPRTVVGAAAALAATALALLPVSSVWGAALSLPLVLPAVLLVFWPVDFMTRRLERTVAGAVVVASGALALAPVGLAILFPMGFWAALGIGAGVGLISFLAAFVAAERFGRSKTAVIIAGVVVLVGTITLSSLPVLPS